VQDEDGQLELDLLRSFCQCRCWCWQIATEHIRRTNRGTSFAAMTIRKLDSISTTWYCP